MYSADLRGILFRTGEPLVLDHQGRLLPESEAVERTHEHGPTGLGQHGPTWDYYREYHLRPDSLLTT